MKTEPLTSSMVGVPRTRLRLLPWVICGLAAVFYCYEYYLRVAPSVMTADLMRTFGVSASALGALVAYYYHAYTPMQLPVGMLMDRFGPRRLLTLACIVCAFGSYLFASTHNIGVAAAGRLFVGFGSAFAFIGVLKLARAWLPADRFAMMSGLTSALGIVGALSGDITMTSMVEWMGWRNTILVSAVLGLVLAVIMFAIIRDRDPEKIGVHESHEPVDGKTVLKNFCAIMCKPSIWLVGLVGCLLYLPTSSFAELWGVMYFRQAWGFTPIEAAYAVSTLFVGWGIMAPFSGLISDKLGNRCKPMMIGGLLAGVLISILIYVPHIPKPLAFVLLFVFGACYSVEVIVFAYACDICSNKAAGTALAITNMLVMLGGSLFQPIIGKLLDLHSVGHVVMGEHIYSIADYQFALSVLPIGLFLAAALILFLKEPGKHKPHIISGAE